MESAELNKTKRVRHSFPRKEIYHRFIHSEEYAYSPANGRQVSCKGNYLVIGDIGRKATIEDIEDMWFYNSNRMIAIIDRNLKRIMINKEYNYHVYSLECAIPDDYTIYYTEEKIPSKDILLNKEQCLRIHSKYLIEQFVIRTLWPYYSIIYANKKTIHVSLNSNNSYGHYYNEILKFVEDNKLKSSSFYNECFNDKYKLRIYTSGWNYIVKEIKLPTLKQIINNRVFTNKEKLLLEQKYFWTKYCYGNRISFNNVVANWNKEVSRDEIIKYLEQKHLYINPELLTKENTWNEYIIKTVEYSRNRYNKYIQDNIAKSNSNYEEAKAKLTENQIYNVNDWRNYKFTPIQRVSYRKFVPPSRNNKYGNWIDAEIVNRTNYEHFNNTLLRLSKDGTTIETSRYAKVPLEAGIKMYKMFMIGRRNAPNKTTWTTSNFGNVKVGIYNLRFITYKDKVTDFGKPLGYKEWLIQIGCHSLWLDDIKEFIKYYNLESKFY